MGGKLKGKINENADQNTLHLSIDAMQNKLYPNFKGIKRPSEDYYLRKMTFHLLGVVNEGTGKGTTFVYDNRLGPTNSNHTISALRTIIMEQLGNKKRIMISMDNCAVNKNRYVSNR